MILKAWGSMLRPGQSFWGPGHLFSEFRRWLRVFIEKSAFADPPPRGTQWALFTVLWFDVFFGVLYVVDFCDFQCPEIPFWRPFSSIFGSPGPLQKQLEVCNFIIFRGLTPFGRHLFRGLDRECVLRLSFYRNLRFWGVLGNQFGTLLVLIVVKNRSA